MFPSQTIDLGERRREVDKKLELMLIDARLSAFAIKTKKTRSS